MAKIITLHIERCDQCPNIDRTQEGSWCRLFGLYGLNVVPYKPPPPQCPLPDAPKEQEQP